MVCSSVGEGVLSVKQAFPLKSGGTGNFLLSWASWGRALDSPSQTLMSQAVT
jgi:hypothetical protein